MTTLLIFGITGDLSRRKLLPALAAICQAGEAGDLRVIGVSRRPVVADKLLATHPELYSITEFLTMDVADPAAYQGLAERLRLGGDDQLLVYLSVPPLAATQIVDYLGLAGLNTPAVKLLFEKPFGVDLASAQDMITRTARYFDEAQLYRIDHYLAKEMAQNIVAFRGGNALFSHLWNDVFIEQIEVVASESLDIEGRADFYEQTGALRDLVQGHLLQLLALTLMDIPPDFDWGQVPSLRAAALEYVRPADPTQALRAQYQGYRAEVQHPDSQVETFVRLDLVSDQPRWQGVPLRLVTGKALARKTTEVRIHLKKLHEAQSNCLVFRIQPGEGIEIELFVKRPGYSRQFDRRYLTFGFPDDTRLPDAYEQVLVDAIHGRKALFTTSREVIRSWQILAPVQQAWQAGQAPLVQYAKGTEWHQVGQAGNNHND